MCISNAVAAVNFTLLCMRYSSLPYMEGSLGAPWGLLGGSWGLLGGSWGLLGGSLGLLGSYFPGLLGRSENSVIQLPQGAQTFGAPGGPGGTRGAQKAVTFFSATLFVTIQRSQ